MKVFHDESNIFVYLNFRLKCYILQKELNKISYVFVFSRFMKDFRKIWFNNLIRHCIRDVLQETCSTR